MLPAFVLVIWSLVNGHVEGPLGGSRADPRTFSSETDCRQALIEIQHERGSWVMGSCLPAYIVR